MTYNYSIEHLRPEYIEKFYNFPLLEKKPIIHVLENNLIKIDGLYLEFGVYQGASIRNIATRIPDNKIVYGFDSFAGLPERWRDGFERGRFKTRIPIFGEKICKKIELVKGWFEDTLPEFCKKHTENVALLHIDCDIYSATKTIFDNLNDKIVPGTIIVFDEIMNYRDHEHHEMKAFDEFLKKRSDLDFEIIGALDIYKKNDIKNYNERRRIKKQDQTMAIKIINKK